MEKGDEEYQGREDLWDEQWPTSAEDAGAHAEAELDAGDELSPFPEVVGTADALEAVRDAEPYMAPTDPPVLPGGQEGIHVATGFGVSPLEEAADDPLPRGDDDIREEALLVLRHDSLTSRYALDVQVEDGIVTLRGPVESIEDAEHAQWLVGELPGVADVVDETVLQEGV